MIRIFLLLGLISVSAFIMSCTGTSNANQNNSANINTNVDPKDLPPEFQPSPIPMGTNANIPGNVAVNGVPKGTPTPGIDPKNAMVKIKPGATPTPGIPDQETIRRQMQGLERPNINSNGAPTQPGGSMMRKRPLKPTATPTP
jgi:hypothetical protein